MESTFYTAKEAAAFLGITESEIFQLVVVKQRLRPILFLMHPPPPFKQQTFELCPASEEYWDPLPAEYFGGFLSDIDDQFRERAFVFVRSSSLAEIEYPFCQKGDSYYATLDVDVISSLLGPIVFEDQYGEKVSIEVIGSKKGVITGPTSMPIILNVTETVYLRLTTDWIFTHFELERVKYGKPINSEMVPKVPIE